jgi:hypothetical protein
MAHADLTHALPAAQALAETAVGVMLDDVRDPELPLVDLGLLAEMADPVARCLAEAEQEVAA